MKTKVLFLSVFLAGVAAIVATVYQDDPPSPEPSVRKMATVHTVTSRIRATPQVTPAESVASQTSFQEQQKPVVPATPPTEAQANAEPPTSAPQPPPKAKPYKPKPPLQDPRAREALHSVGFDRQSDAYWLEAINNPKLPAHERKDLIEDLNEVGFTDLKNLSPVDCQLIANRLELINELEPKALDQVNAEAFQEAHKDLTKMLARRRVP